MDRWERVTYELWLDLHDVGPAFIFGVLASADISQAVSIKSSIKERLVEKETQREARGLSR
jgi:hypothetical protein